MQYWIWLLDKHGDPYIFSDAILPGIVAEETIARMEANWVADNLDLCGECYGHRALGHVIEEGTGRKLCPLLFAETFKPGWTANDVM